MITPQPLVVSMGEPAGIGPDIILMAFAKRVAFELPFFYVNGDIRVLDERAQQLGLDLSLKSIQEASEVYDVFAEGLPVKTVGSLAPVTPGEINGANGAFVIETIKQSVVDIRDKRASGLVTAPIHKGALYETGFSFPGHTEYLASLSEAYFGKVVTPVMMLASDELCVVPLTIHVALKDVPDLISEELILTTVRTLVKDLQNRFAIKTPRVVLTGLNPHAGEGGKMGREEIEIIQPAIETLKAEGYVISGPVSGDTCFHIAARQSYDVVVAMYHDQALIPLKTLSFDEGVNITLGLPFVRTSPDHGTALDIAGRGKANPLSFIYALKKAAQLIAYSHLSGQVDG